MSGRAAIGGLLLAGLLATAGCRGGGESGKSLFESACSRCHGNDGKGGLITPETNGVKSRDLSDPAWQKNVTDEELRQIVRDGRRSMPAFGHVLSLDRIDAIVKHMRTLAPPLPAAATGPSAPQPAPVAAPAESPKPQ